jgi:hypothetical protein
MPEEAHISLVGKTVGNEPCEVLAHARYQLEFSVGASLPTDGNKRTALTNNQNPREPGEDADKTAGKDFLSANAIRKLPH